ncbi:ubiquitin-conjugating enzyme E2 [Paraburkholderia strydomiana]|uniref:ubiquitin-conjugating enzyme E2 n=1 Tax=Paraburkholderia strydomiana TaxID=1245417 RepID=UPI0038BC164D
MSAIDERIAQDLEKLANLSKQTNGRVRVVGVIGTPAKRIDVELDYPTAPTRDYPKRVQNTTALKIELMSRYPFVEPTAAITTPIFHPNVFASGKICLGAKWLPTQGLDLLVRRVIQIITFDPEVLNERSPANGSAVDWYRSALRANPEAFPTTRQTARASTPSVQESVIVQCSSCGARLRIPGGKSGEVACPKCSHRFNVSS